MSTEIKRIDSLILKWEALGIYVRCTYSGELKHIPNFVYP